MIQRLKAAFDFTCYMLHRVFTGRYTLFLEAEVKRLAHDNDELWKALCKMRGAAPPAMIGEERIQQIAPALGLTAEQAATPKKMIPRRWPQQKAELEAKSRAAAADLRRRAAITPIRAVEEPAAAGGLTERIMEQAAPDAKIPEADQDTSAWPEVAAPREAS